MDKGELHNSDVEPQAQSEIPAVQSGAEGSGSGRSEERVCEGQHTRSAPFPPAARKTFWVKRLNTFYQYTLVSLNEFETKGEIVKTAKVRTAGGLELVCRRDELFTQEQYEAELARRRKIAYDEDRPARLREAQKKYHKLIGLWEAGHRTPQDLMKCTGEGTAMYWGGQIAAAKRWELIK